MAESSISKFVKGMGTAQDSRDSLQAQINKMESLKEARPDAYEQLGGDSKLQELKDKLAEQQESQG